MFREFFILVCLAYSVNSARIELETNWYYVAYTCVETRGDNFGHVVYRGADMFIGGVKLVYKSGFVGCDHQYQSHWGCQYKLNMLQMTITDYKNRVIYPAPRLVTRDANGFYEIPGFNLNSPQLVLSDFGNPTFLKSGDMLKIWYGEDLLNVSEQDNHGRTCMDVYVYKL